MKKLDPQVVQNIATVIAALFKKGAVWHEWCLPVNRIKDAVVALKLYGYDDDKQAYVEAVVRSALRKLAVEGVLRRRVSAGITHYEANLPEGA